ncbi:putative DNA-binding WGR domain protein [Bosea sp. AK1]|uniref:WGR domain-containing protein n=1 Tax=Bosea sp. AK1 TaxID=2587160 RepID=UPI0011548BDF|nr:WGR domain-containing protein [Bosea sp. AK1]TQI65227.1 putative DNA-binding WGR domain protein [Bosea sp. AK1]
MSLLHILLERIDPSQNMARYYVLSIEPTLFGDSALVREWGRIGSSRQRRSEFFPQPSDAHLALDTWLRRKRRRGYQPRA